MLGTRARQAGAFFIFVGLIAGGWGYVRFRHSIDSATFEGGKPSARAGLTKDQLAEALKDTAVFYRFPSEMDLPTEGPNPNPKKIRAILQYAFDSRLQEAMEGLFRSYGPDHGALVVIEATTGRVLSMVSYTRRSQDPSATENLAIRSSFPSASIFKMVTAAAAIEANQYSADTIIPFNGRNHTLYRNHVLKDRPNRWTHYITLKDAFAKSVNTVFGKIGAYTVGAEGLKQYAGRFGFNRKIAADIPVEQGKADIPSDAWGLAESASGYTRDNTMSPLQGALMAAAIVNDGMMMEPYVVQSVFSVDGKQLYEVDPKVSNVAVDRATAQEIRALMHQTIARGTSQKAFRGFFKGRYSYLSVGGKTGSLTGMNPLGKYDWFVGFAEGGPNRLAIAALTINENVWRVKSSFLARKAIEVYFRDKAPPGL